MIRQRQCIGAPVGLVVGLASDRAGAGAACACAAAWRVHQPSEWIAPMPSPKSKRKTHHSDRLCMSDILVLAYWGSVYKGVSGSRSRRLGQIVNDGNSC